jgi:membrane associated rhomboid family serine protease
MISAAVGFQCPDCVKKGAKASRQGRGPFGGAVSQNPATTTVVIIAVNVAVWLAILVTGGALGWLTQWLSLSLHGLCELVEPAGYYIPGETWAQCMTQSQATTQWIPGFADGAVWQPFTSMFTHEEFMHLAFNMLALWFLGPQLERIVGRARFLTLYLLSGLTGSAVVLWLSAPMSSTLGASGAVFGLMGGLMIIAIRVHANMQMIWIWLGINAVYTFMNPGVSWQGHLGGLLGGVAIGAIIAYASRMSRTLGPRADRDRIQIGLLCAFGVLVVAAMAVRAFVP